ncbi:MAG: hypothetical protein JXR95_00525 [Deltaproteobacteria bacterium]|nr:hypothetical protein [Deltaproteobacteria bacterium]
MKIILLMTIGVLLSGCGNNSSTSTGNRIKQKKDKMLDKKTGSSKDSKNDPANSECLIKKLENAGKGVSGIRLELTGDVFGGLKLGMKKDEVIRLLGEPQSKSKPTMEAATGYMRSEWKWNSRGVKLSMNEGKSSTTVIFISLRSPFSGKSSCGIGIGDLYSKMLRIYSKYKNIDTPDPESRVFGSIYGGILFGEKDGKISSIDVGAFAE